MSNKDSFIRVLLALVFLLLFALFVYVAKEVSPNRGDAKLKELQGLSSETPTYPSFQIVNKTYSSRYLDAGVYEYYRSTAKYDDVKEFYSGTLSQRGWSLDAEDEGKKITFRKGELRIVIEFAGDDTDHSWNYAVDFLWK